MNKRPSLVLLPLLLAGVFLFAVPKSLRAQDFSGGLEQEQEEDEAQPDPDDYRFKDHFRFGGNVGLQIGNVTFINVSPMAGYQFNERFMMGVRGTYQYFRISGFTNFESHVYGGSTFARFFPFEQFFVHGEYERLNGFFANSPGRVSIPFLYVGLGYLQPISSRVGISATALYEVLRSRYSPYGFPIIRVGLVATL